MGILSVQWEGSFLGITGPSLGDAWRVSEKQHLAEEVPYYYCLSSSEAASLKEHGWSGPAGLCYDFMIYCDLF